MQTSLITGVLGGVGSEMVGYLLKNTDQFVLGMTRRKSQINYSNIKNYLNNPRFKLVWGDLTDSSNISEVIRTTKPDYLYNFAAFTHVQPSFEFPESVYDINVLGLMRILDSIRKHKISCRVYQAGSTEQIANSNDEVLNENTAPSARNFYGSSKSAAAELIRVYREKYGMYAVNGINCNYEGITRPLEFLVPKTTQGIAKIKRAILNNEDFEPLKLGFLDAKRQWGGVADMVDAAYRMLNQEKFNEHFTDPKDYLVASNEPVSVRELVEKTCRVAQLSIEWEDFGLRERAVYTGQTLKRTIIKVSSEFYREESKVLKLDSSLIRKELKWSPVVTLDQIVKEMFDWHFSQS